MLRRHVPHIVAARFNLQKSDEKTTKNAGSGLTKRSKSESVISKWRWRPEKAADKSNEDWKLLRTSQGFGTQSSSGTWPGRPRSGAAPAWTDSLEKFITEGLCLGCGGDYQYKGALKVNIDSSEYTGYKYFYNRPGYRVKARSCEDARFIHINFVLLAEIRHFETRSEMISNGAPTPVPLNEIIITKRLVVL
ncbi:unnamed protein product [Euphydryas editha]|uniref:Uncharacterized protein n=1 Tax=Euphydryas editha TaxID=104508 RepID=A0AAU9U918_EUPED|nr:unnamed protein product [Euphydryas editha]